MIDTDKLASGWLAMLSIGAASALGYALIGLPNVLALGVLAGLLEAVPLIGPVLAVGPPLLVAVPLGVHTVLLVVGLAVILQLIENNVLIPRIMHRAVGVSALVGLLAVLLRGLLPVDEISSWSERLVGVALMAVGVWSGHRLFRTRVHVHPHVHDGVPHSHVHFHGASGLTHGRAPAVEHSHAHASFGFGILHGLAGSSHS